MASPSTTAKVRASDAKTKAELEAEVERLRSDVTTLKDQLSAAGQNSYDSAKRVASSGIENLKVRSEAAIEDIREQAHDYEAQLTDAVREKPISALAIAAGVGFVLALLTRR
ncbi:MAG: hypothetical protein ABW191_03615 [Aliihoeflea sp.]|jgi:ElaB/YqjD/DUF883 family membrane-anchored ribosome-binding protein